jgi:hypothetical protein
MVVLAARWLKTRRKQNGENKSLLSKCRQAETEIGEKRKQQLGQQVRNSTQDELRWHGTQKSNRSTMNNLNSRTDRQEKEKQAPNGPVAWE